MFPMRLALFFVPLALLVGCGEPINQPLVSAQYPPGTGMVNAASEPQPINSLPPGAANYSSAPGAIQPNYFSLKLGAY